MANQFGIFPKELHGHITLATYTGEDEAAFIASCKAILSGYGKFAVRYDKVDIWVSVPESESIIVAVPRRETAMAAMQKEIAQLPGVMASPIGLLHPVADVSAVINALVMADPQVAGCRRVKGEKYVCYAR